MLKKTLICVVSGALLWGCTAMMQNGGVMVTPCNTNICQVMVKVDLTQTPPVTVDIPVLPIDKNNHGQNGNGVLIHWVLVSSPDYTFREDSIQFYDPNSPSQFDIPRPQPQQNGNQFEVRDQNTDGVKWGYQIKVYNRKSGVWIPLDPWIQNG